MQLIQGILIVFFLFALYRVLALCHGGQLSWYSALAWVALWVVAGMIVLFPNSTAFIAKRVGVGRGADLVVYSSLSILFFIIFKLTLRVEKMNRELTVLVRQLAIKDSKKKSPSDPL